ncbi:MAG: hypothetical protein GX615_09765, partial [Lentisphaerae bacterium]|nr:hypothetical protein [Lentisphaerota bacterium]
MFVKAEGAEAAEQDVVTEQALGQEADGIGTEEVARERGEAELCAGAFGFEEAEGGGKREPVVLAAGIGEIAFLGEVTQALDAVVTAVDLALPGCGGGREDEAALLNDHEEEEAVDQVEQVLVAGFGGERAVGNGAAKGRVGGMGQKPVAEIADGLLDGAAEAVADARAGVEGVLMVALDEAFGGGVAGDGQTGGVEQAVEEREIGEKAVGEDAIEVELEVAELDEAGAVAQQAQEAAIGDDAVELVVQVDVFLHHGVGRHAQGWRPAGRPYFGLAIEAGGIAVADDVDGGPGAVDGAVGDGVGLAVEFGAFGLVFELVAEEAEEGDDPLLAGFGGQSRHMGNRQIATVPIPCFPIPYLPIAYLPALHFALEDAPVVLGVGPGAGDLVL